MKKVYLAVFIITLLSFSLATAATGWSILDVFKGKQAKQSEIYDVGGIDTMAAPTDDILGSSTVIPLQPADPGSMSCNAQIAQNRQLLILIIDHLGIQGAETITGQPIRNVARNTRARDAQTMRATSRQRTIERAPIRQVRRPGVIERAPTTPIQIQRGPDLYGEAYDEGCEKDCHDACAEQFPHDINDGPIEDNEDVFWFEECFDGCVEAFCS